MFVSGSAPPRIAPRGEGALDLDRTAKSRRSHAAERTSTLRALQTSAGALAFATHERQAPPRLAWHGSPGRSPRVLDPRPASRRRLTSLAGGTRALARTR